MPNVGDPAPLFSGVDILTGDPFELAPHKGECVLVAFHGVTWCDPCQFAVPLLQEVWAEYQNQAVRFVVVSVNEDPSPAVLQQMGITMPWLVDPAIATLYEVGGSVPRYFFLDHDLKIAKIQGGLFSSDPEGQKNGVRGAIDECLGPQHRIPFPYWEAVAILIFGGVTVGGSGVVITPGGKPIPVPPGDPLARLTPEKRDVLIGLAIGELAGRVSDAEARKRLERAGLRTAQRALQKLLAATETAVQHAH